MFDALFVEQIGYGSEMDTDIPVLLSVVSHSIGGVGDIMDGLMIRMVQPNGSIDLVSEPEASI